MRRVQTAPARFSAKIPPSIRDTTRETVWSGAGRLALPASCLMAWNVQVQV